MLHVRHNLITADPSQLSDSVKFIENEVRPNVENQPGNLGVALQLNPELGVAILESFWVSGDALRASERVVAPSRAAAVRRATGTAPSSATLCRCSSWRPRCAAARASGSRGWKSTVGGRGHDRGDR